MEKELDVFNDLEKEEEKVMVAISQEHKTNFEEKSGARCILQSYKHLFFGLHGITQ